jgi:hypothetical protein
MRGQVRFRVAKLLAFNPIWNGQLRAFFDCAERCGTTDEKEESQGRGQNMTFIATQTGFMRLEDSAKLLRAIFPNYPSLEPHYPAPVLEQIQDSADRSR